jgi:hypothetical protein
MDPPAARAGVEYGALVFDTKTALGKVGAIAEPRMTYPWPYDGQWQSSTTALIVVDMQRDHLDPGRNRRSP